MKTFRQWFASPGILILGSMEDTWETAENKEIVGKDKLRREGCS